MDHAAPREERPETLPPDAPEADALDQARDWAADADRRELGAPPIDVPEADFLEQQEPAGLEEEER